MSRRSYRISARRRLGGLRWRAAVRCAQLRGLAVRCRLRKPVGPGPGHPEDPGFESSVLTAEEEDWLGELHAEWFPADAEGPRRHPVDYDLPSGDGEL